MTQPDTIAAVIGELRLVITQLEQAQRMAEPQAATATADVDALTGCADDQSALGRAIGAAGPAMVKSVLRDALRVPPSERQGFHDEVGRQPIGRRAEWDALAANAAGLLEERDVLRAALATATTERADYADTLADLVHDKAELMAQVQMARAALATAEQERDAAQAIIKHALGA